MNEVAIVDFFASYAYQPLFVYAFIILFMTASSFGLPIPEEMTLVSAGLVAYMAMHPDKFPPPTPDAEGVNLIILSIVCFVAVLGSDILIYFLGKIFGRRIVQSKFFNKRISQDRFNKINNVFNKYSHWACGLFRFTPGVRFPGHLSCGLMGVPLWKFILIDGAAALISVPTQVLLVAYYGEVILDKIKEFKIAAGVVILALLAFWILKRLYQMFTTKRARD
ncbi:MAG: DedA family protein [Bacteriovoracaceae bacterium]|nr:DedA family protein [Bacteriovoracaceae bacterium]